MILTAATTDLFAFDEARLDELTTRHGTPFFAYDLAAARERFTGLRAALPARVRLAYAVKSNPGLPLLETFAEQGAWFDCASAGEVSTGMPDLVEGQVRAYLLYQLTSVEEAVAPAPFSDLAVQEGLREFLLQQLDQRRLVRARIELVRGSFVHPQDLRTFLARGELASSRGR